MENQTRFDLNAAIESWRNELAAQPNLASDDRRELETHLRDAIAGFQQRGLNDEESFWLARRRVGQPRQIGEEFEKADPTKIWRERALWVVLVLCFLQIWEATFPSVERYLLEHLHPKLPWELLAFYLKLACYLPVFCFVVVLARGQFWIERLFRFVFRSRVQFILMAAVLVLVSHYFSQSDSYWPTEWPTNGNWILLDWFYGYCVTLLLTQMWSFTLIGLIAWLMPSQNRKTPKRAPLPLKPIQSVCIVR
jgi:hypothetical protein